MKTLLVVLAVLGWLLLAVWVIDALAACWTNVVTGQNGRTVVCITCCEGSVCNVNCF